VSGRDRLYPVYIHSAVGAKWRDLNWESLNGLVLSDRMAMLFPGTFCHPSCFRVVCAVVSYFGLSSRTRQSRRCLSPFGVSSKIINVPTIPSYQRPTVMTRVPQISPYNARTHILIVVRVNIESLERKSMAGFFVRVVAPTWPSIN
jgi:hypothetical protein